MLLDNKKLERERLEKILLEEMDEETYFNLPIEKRKEIDDKLLETKKLRLKRYFLLFINFLKIKFSKQGGLFTK